MVLYPTVSLVSINPEGSDNHTARDAYALAQGRVSGGERPKAEVQTERAMSLTVLVFGRRPPERAEYLVIAGVQ